MSTSPVLAPALAAAPSSRHASFAARFARNRGAVAGAVLLALVAFLAAGAGWLYPADPLRIVGAPEIWPFESWRYPLGTDSMGRDIAAMIAHGARATLLIGLVAAATATLIGVSVGAAAAWAGGWVDEGLMRVAELFQIIPNVVFVLTVVSILGPRIEHITLAVGLVSWPPIARLTRAEFLSFKEREFVQACRALGMSPVRIVAAEILPNALPPVIVMSSLVVAGAILYESVVSFLGLGDPNIASWGRLVGEGRSLIRSSWYICAVPGVAIMLAVLSLNLVGDGLNDALNPKLQKR
ncbi:ABC transporter permease [Achromobacter insolitus]|uniref:ABC transporter permease n=1 Tax=Achromobacter TaxID=222 RepID=UPI0007C381CB|nr:MULTISPECIES: ABC transporter permease [Achromobacter]GLK93722.1 ABC transporter permease [Achromobacter xylosoxidans]MCP1403500.1 peptide/nickel transport system permease protein [Achromobacter insolitus]MEB3096835.1 ABC transporter permease [Achromobacter sp. D10]NGT15195.1 ABC transporter permease [Achromobacter insolitus]OAD15864.1 ABC transporter permease [Achromobacter insolitus]